MKRVRWGILGTATIAREAVIPAMLKPQYGEHLELVGIASRDLAKARTVASTFGMGKAFGTYEALLADASVDAVYIPLPNHLHVPYAILALEAGKHVLCEKPIALSSHQAEELLRAAEKRPDLKVMEAFMYRHHPQWQWARQVVRAGQLGDVQAVHSCFTFLDDNPEGILHHAAWGGGCLMDIGCYPVSLSRWLLDSEPVRATAVFENDSASGVDRSVSGLLEFEAGVATFCCSTQLAPFQRVSVIGTRGRLELELPFNPPTDQPHRALLEQGGVAEIVSFDICDQYGIQADRFSRAILERTDVLTPIEDGVANMRVIEAMVQNGHERCAPHAAKMFEGRSK